MYLLFCVCFPEFAFRLAIVYCLTYPLTLPYFRAENGIDRGYILSTLARTDGINLHLGMAPSCVYRPCVLQEEA